MAQKALANLKEAGIQRPVDEQGRVRKIVSLEDAGYFSASAGSGLEAVGVEPYIAPARHKHHAAQAAAAAGEVAGQGGCQGGEAGEVADGEGGGGVRAGKGDSRAGVRPDQRGARVPPLQQARAEQGQGRMEPGLPDPQPPQALALRLRTQCKL